MRILHAIGSINPVTGGTYQVLQHLLPELAKSGVENEVVCLDDPTEGFLKNVSFPVHALGASRGPWQYHPALLDWLQGQIAHFDVIIGHGLWIYPGYAVRKVIRSLKRKGGSVAVPPVFIMPHGMLDPYFQRSSQRRIKALRNAVYWKLIERSVVNEADGLLFTSETERLLARQPFRPYSPKREIIVGFGIPAPPPYTPAMQNAFRARCPDLNAEPYLLFFGRIHYKKGVDILLNAYAGKLEQASKLGVSLPHLVIAGPGLETAYGQQMQRFVADRPALEGRVFFTGMVTGDAKWGALYGCQAFVLPSHQENFGIAVVEALACGRPVLISSQVNIWREIEQANGGLVTENSVEAVEQLLDTWFTLPEQQKRAMGARARLAYDHFFAIGPAAGRLLKAVSVRSLGAADRQ